MRKLIFLNENLNVFRLVFGASQYFVFIDPSKVSAKDPFFSFESIQDEIANNSGLGLTKEAKAKMSQGKYL